MATSHQQPLLPPPLAATHPNAPLVVQQPADGSGAGGSGSGGQGAHALPEQPSPSHFIVVQAPTPVLSPQGLSHLGNRDLLPPGGLYPPLLEAEEVGVPNGHTAASDEASDGEESDGPGSDGERSDASGASSSGGCSEPLSDEELPNGVAKDVSVLAAVEPEPVGEPKSPVTPSVRPASAGDPISAAREAEGVENVPATLAMSDSSYPAENLPPRTGISIPMEKNAPVYSRAVPTTPEPFYNTPEALFDDIVRLEADRISHPENVKNIIVYDSMEPRVVEGQSPRLAESQGPGLHEKLEPFYAVQGPADTTLVFESRFESGNLRRAVQVYDCEYDLILNPDYNTKVHTQWYLFRVSNTRKGRPYRFNIINMVKPTSVYNEGMRPLIYSVTDASEKGVGWVRGTENIAYYQNGIRRREQGKSGDKGPNYFTLTFTVTFQHDNDSVYFSHCYPYTYTDLQKDLQELEADPAVAKLFRRRKLCETLAGNACDLITITSFNSEPAALRSRRSVVITARVHPGESNASWIMKGMLDYLTGTSLDARILRDNFVFKIVPMLNPDGVIVGNYRCSLAGTDLNRQWDDPSRKMHPTIFFAKSMIRHLMHDRDVILYIDIHGHSRKKNVFMYGNSEFQGIKEKIFPRLLSKSSDCFNFDDCCFKIQKSKESTARVVAYRDLGISNAFTLEASFCGADFGALADQHFTTRHLEEMGYMVCDAILDFCDPDQSKVAMISKELQVLFPDDGNSDDVSDSAEDDEDKMRRRRRKAKSKKKDKEKAKKKKAASKREVQAERELQSRQAQDQRDRVMQELIAEGLAVGDGSLPAREMTESDRLRLEWRSNQKSRDSRERGWGSADAAAAVAASSDTDRVRRSPPTNESGEARGRSSTSKSRKSTSTSTKSKEKSKDKQPSRVREPSAGAAIAAATAGLASAAAAAVPPTSSNGGQPGINQWGSSRSSGDLSLPKEKPRKGYADGAGTEQQVVPVQPVVVASISEGTAEVENPGREQRKKYGKAVSQSESPRGHGSDKGFIHVQQAEFGSSDAPRTSAAFPPLTTNASRRGGKQPDTRV